MLKSFNSFTEKPCSMNFTRVGDNCYLFVANKPCNWKSANNICRSYGAHLAELETLNENNDIAAYLLNHRREFDDFNSFWLGGLNPGLLWIWSTSARPVNPNVNLTQIHNSTQSTTSPIKSSMKINNNKGTANKKITNNNATSTVNKVSNNATKTENDAIVIEGNGRCLGLTYKSDKHIYKLHGLECTSQQKFICELPQDHMDNEIDRMAKELFN